MQVENESGGTGIIRLIDKCLDLFEMTVSALALLGMTVSVLLAIVLRYVLTVSYTHLTLPTNREV